MFNKCRFHPLFTEPCLICLREKSEAKRKEKEFIEEQRKLANEYHKQRRGATTSVV